MCELYYTYNSIRHILYYIYSFIIFQHCEQIRVYQTCLIYCALNVLSWNVAIIYIRYSICTLNS